MRGLIPILLAGCSFDRGYVNVPDAPPDADPTVDTDGDGVPDVKDNCPKIANPDQRDWDHDGHGDVCDLCPHLASATDPDADGDGVGDDCDPQPGVQNQRLYWMGFYDDTEITGWRNFMNNGDWVVQTGALDQTLAASNAILDAPTDTGDVYFATRIAVTSALTSSGTEFGFCDGDIAPGHQYYCCAVNGANVRAVSSWEAPPASPGQVVMTAPWSGSVATGAAVDITGTMTSTQHQCTFAQGAVTASAATVRGTPTPGAPCFYTVGGVVGSWDYLFVVAMK